ncbi:MAG: hypothetical protein Q9201_002704 [Fulgogasparrea decipioides]
MSLAVSINLFWAAVLTVVFPKLSDALTPTGAIGFFAGLNVIAFLMIFLWVPETKQRTLEELDYICTFLTNPYPVAGYPNLICHHSRSSNSAAYALPGHQSTPVHFAAVHTAPRRGAGTAL